MTETIGKAEKNYVKACITFDKSMIRIRQEYRRACKRTCRNFDKEFIIYMKSK